MISAVGKVLFAVLSVLYPVLIFCGFFLWDLSPRRLSLLPLLLAAFYAASLVRRHRNHTVPDTKEFFFVGCLLLCGVLSFVLNNATFFKFYPALVNVGFLGLFASSLQSKSNMAFRFATLAGRRILLAADRWYVERYCARVTVAWCVFFAVNASVSIGISLFGSIKAWSIYTGIVSYVLMGILFAVEFVIRKIKQRRWHVYCPISKLAADSRPDDSVVCFEGNGPEDGAKTWADFKSDVSKLRSAVERENFSAWILNAEDSYHFLIAIFALFQSHKKILISANCQPEYICELRRGCVGFLNDTGAEGALQIPDVLKIFSADKPWEPFDASAAEASLFTSGTTGKPKEVFKTAQMFENEVAAISARFEKELVGRNAYTTVNHHHIYGMAFGVLLPISVGIPIRRRRFEFPEELGRIVREKAFIIASPAFLKRLVCTNKEKIPFRSKPFWLSAGGVLPDDVALRVGEISGIGVQEIYGCTEAGAVATRNICRETLWTPIPPNTLRLSEKGLLKIRSSYADRGEFTTGDLGEIKPDGRFRLLGRTDSIVKIEEKRISLPEVENRLRETGLVRDMRVVPMKGKREYLAAAIVLNDAGIQKWKHSPKREINEFFRKFLSRFLESTVLPRKWRYLEELPQDAMGKVRTREITPLFSLPESSNFKILRYRFDERKLEVKVLFPETSDFYDGHFPEYKLLPAVAQVDTLFRLVRMFWNADAKLDSFQRLKFTAVIPPNVPLMIEENLDEKGEKIRFKIRREDGKACSSGSILLKGAADAL